MDCSEVRKRFVDYIDGDLDEHEHIVVENHLAECYLCKEDFDDLDSILRVCEDVLHHPHPVNRFAELRLRTTDAVTRPGLVPFRHRLRVGELFGRLAVAALVVFMVAVSPAAMKATEWLFTPPADPTSLVNGASFVRLGLPAERPFVQRRHKIKTFLGINGDEMVAASDLGFSVSVRN